MRESRNTNPVWKRPTAVHTKKEPSILLGGRRFYYFMVAFFLFFILPSISNAQNKVVAYVPNWINLNTYVNQIDYAKLTHINIAFENPVNASGDLSFNSANNALITKAKANNVK